MISIFDEDGERLPITWHGIDFNEKEVGQDDGIFTESVAFSTPINFQSEVHPQISKAGGGIEYYNPRVASRVLNIKARIQAPKLGRLMARLMDIQQNFSPLELQFKHHDDPNGVHLWPVTTGRPAWIDSRPLQFTRLNDGSLWPDVLDEWTDGKMLLEYHVAPLELPDPITSTISTGYGAMLNLSWLVLDGGRAFDRVEDTLVGDGNIHAVWSVAPMWPRFTFTATGAGSATLTIAVTAGDYSETLVVDASGLTNLEEVVIDTRDRTIKVDGVVDTSKCSYVSGGWPILRGDDRTDAVAWTNTTNTTDRTTHYRQADYS